MQKAQTIQDVILILDRILEDATTQNSPLGYFPALYRKVTLKVKEGIANGFFQDGPRMEKLDVVFANRYFDAYFAYQEQRPLTQSWEKAFTMSSYYRPIVLQHLLLGINAHINLDLGIAAAQISSRATIDDLEVDFNRINEILAALVEEVQGELAAITPFFRELLCRTGQLDDIIIELSLEKVRTDAWEFAQQLVGNPEKQSTSIKQKDRSVEKRARQIAQPGIIPNVIIWILRLSERGTIPDKIEELKN